VSDITPEQSEVVRRVRLAMIEAGSPMVALGRRGKLTPRLPGREPAQRKPKRENLHRVDGRNHCMLCGELGHNRLRHNETSRTAQAIVLVRDQGMTIREAAKRLGIAFQGVAQAWRRRYADDPTPGLMDRKSTMRRIVTLAVAGRTQSEIAEEVGCTQGHVSWALSRRGIKAKRDYFYFDEDDIAKATQIVLAGGSYTDAAAEVVGSAGAYQLSRLLRERGVFSTATGRGRMDGRIQRAITRVIAGESVPDACRAERCSTPAVYLATIEVRRMRGQVIHAFKIETVHIPAEHDTTDIRHRWVCSCRCVGGWKTRANSARIGGVRHVAMLKRKPVAGSGQGEQAEEHW
jgi:transposase